MNEYENSGHMIQICEADLLTSKEIYFIPHHAVIRPELMKLQVIFRRICKNMSGSFLNDKFCQVQI